MEKEKDLDLIAEAEHKLKTQKVKIDELKDEKTNDTKKAHADYEAVVQRIDQLFERDLVEIERLKREAEEKKKKSIADAKVHLQRVLDSIEAKY
jgi:hypothetical protein